MRQHGSNEKQRAQRSRTQHGPALPFFAFSLPSFLFPSLPWEPAEWRLRAAGPPRRRAALRDPPPAGSAACRAPPLPFLPFPFSLRLRSPRSVPALPSPPPGPAAPLIAAAVAVPAPPPPLEARPGSSAPPAGAEPGLCGGSCGWEQGDPPEPCPGGSAQGCLRRGRRLGFVCSPCAPGRVTDPAPG